MTMRTHYPEMPKMLEELFTTLNLPPILIISPQLVCIVHLLGDLNTTGGTKNTIIVSNTLNTSKTTLTA
jgi:hypothetical protein